MLILTDTVDNFWVNVIANYQEKHLKPVSSAELTIENNKNEPEVVDDAKNALLLNIFKETLGVAIGEVKISKKLVESPLCLSQSEGGMSIRMERYLYEQKQLPFMSPKILEVNPNHPIIEKLYEKAKNEQKVDDEINNLFDVACIEAGEILRKPSAFIKRMYELMD